MRCWPRDSTWTNPASRSTRRWRETAGWESAGRAPTSSPAGWGRSASRSSTARREGSATTSKISTKTNIRRSKYICHCYVPRRGKWPRFGGLSHASFEGPRRGRGAGAGVVSPAMWLQRIFLAIPAPGSADDGEPWGRRFRLYGIMIAAGVIACLEMARVRWQKRGGDPEDMSAVALWAVPAGLVGARVYHLITDRVNY